MWQPTEEWCLRAGIFSFCVWHRRENGMRDHPDVPFDAWLRYTPDDIEEPTFMDDALEPLSKGAHRRTRPIQADDIVRYAQAAEPSEIYRVGDINFRRKLRSA